METKEQKQFYVVVNGQRVEVTEEVYRAYVRPVRAQQRAARRNWRCVLKAEKYGLVRCKKDCNECPYAMQGNIPTGNETSFETLNESGYDAPSLFDMESDLIDREEKIERAAKILEAIKQLNERQQYIIREIYFNSKTQAEVSRALRIDKTSTSKAVGGIGLFKKNFRKKLENFPLDRQLFKLFVLVIVKGVEPTSEMTAVLSEIVPISGTNIIRR